MGICVLYKIINHIPVFHDPSNSLQLIDGRPIPLNK